MERVLIEILAIVEEIRDLLAERKYGTPSETPAPKPRGMPKNPKVEITKKGDKWVVSGQIPPDSRWTTCKRCNAPVTWLESQFGKSLPYEKNGEPHPRECVQLPF